MRPGLDADGVDSAARRWEQMLQRSTTLAPRIADEVFDVLERDMAEQFATGRGWAPNKPDTIRRKAKKGQPNRPLVATGQLMASLTDRHAEGATRRVLADELFFSSRLRAKKSTPKSGQPLLTRIHTNARESNPHGLPRRKVVVLRTDTRQQILRLAQQELTS